MNVETGENECTSVYTSPGRDQPDCYLGCPFAADIQYHAIFSRFPASRSFSRMAISATKAH